MFGVLRVEIEWWSDDDGAVVLAVLVFVGALIV